MSPVEPVLDSSSPPVASVVPELEDESSVSAVPELVVSEIADDELDELDVDSGKPEPMLELDAGSSVDDDVSDDPPSVSAGVDPDTQPALARREINADRSATFMS